MKTKKIKIILFTIMVMMYFGVVIVPMTGADSQDVTVTWIIPGDDTITISFPTSEGKIEFDATSVGQNFSKLGATSQTESTAALRVTNQGNQALLIQGKFTTALPPGVTYVNFSVGDNTNGTNGQWTNATAQTNQTMKTSLADGTSEDFWFWSSGIEVAKTAGISKTLRVYSSGA
jgi:hypothetical protein